MKDQEDNTGLTDISRRIIPGSSLHKALCKYMTSTGSRYVGLSVPSTYPRNYSREKGKFWKKFPTDYVDEVESLLAQGSPRYVLNINRIKDTAQLVQVESEETYNRVLLSLFVQSVQQINPTSRLLYSMVNVKPLHGLGVFISCETNQCCFRYLVAKVHRPSYSESDIDIRLYVRDHVHHNSLLDLSVISKWMNCEYHTLY